MARGSKGNIFPIAVTVTLLLAGCLGTEAPPEPVAHISGPEGPALLNQTLTFDGSFSNDEDYEIVEYLWDFGDGRGDTGPIVNHSYRDWGKFTVRLVVVNSQGGAASETFRVEVAKPNTPPLAEAGEDLAAIVNEPVSFNGRFSEDAEGPIAKYEWNFGDKSTGEGAEPTHIYTEPGDYKVTLTVTDEDNATATDKLNVTVRLRSYKVLWEPQFVTWKAENRQLAEEARFETVEVIPFDNLSRVQVNLSWQDTLDTGTPDLVFPDTFSLDAGGPEAALHQSAQDTDGAINFTFQLAAQPGDIESFAAFNLTHLYDQLTERGYWSTQGKGAWGVLIVLEDAPPDTGIPLSDDTGNGFDWNIDLVYYTAKVTEVTG